MLPAKSAAIHAAADRWGTNQSLVQHPRRSLGAAIYAFHVPILDTISIDQVQIAFTNDDLVDGSLDRNLHVDKVMLDGVIYQTESPTVFSNGTWLPIDGIQPGYRRSEVLHTNGYLQYATGPGSLVEIYAAGTTGQENMSLVVDNSIANDWTAVGGDAHASRFLKFAYRAAELVRPDQVQVWFTNDVYAPPIDYDLRVDRIVMMVSRMRRKRIQPIRRVHMCQAMGGTTGFLGTGVAKLERLF